MGPCTGHGSGGTRISSAYNIRWQVGIPSFKCVTFGHVIHKLVQHIPKEGGSEQEGDLSQVSLYKGLQYMLSCIDISLDTTPFCVISFSSKSFPYIAYWENK